MSTTTTLLQHTLLSLLLTTVSAQDPAPTPIPTPAETVRSTLLANRLCPVHDLEDPVAGSMGTWAAGSLYKVQLGATTTFYPALGLDYPHNEPWAWHTSLVRCGETTLGLHHEPRRVADYRYEIELGNGVVERYDVLAEGLEQSFVIASPLGQGDIEIRGSVTTNLRPGVLRADGSMPFFDAQDRAAVTYGMATAIDARGNRIRLAASWRHGELSLPVPASFLANATYPVVVDPLLTPITISDVPAPVLFAQATGVTIERDDSTSTHNVMVAIERAWSATDTDLDLVLTNDSWQNPVTVFSDISGGLAQQATLAFVAGPNRWIAAFVRNIGGIEQGRFLTRAAGNTTWSNTLTAFAVPSGVRELHPKLGGHRRTGSSGNLALLVNEREPAGSSGNGNATSVWARTIDVTNNNQSTPFQLSSTLLGTDAEAPCVSRDSNGHAWMVAWQNWNSLTSSHWAVLGRRIDATGQVTPGSFADDQGSFQLHRTGPQVDGSDGRYLLTYAVSDAITFGGKIAGPEGTTLRTQRFDWVDAAAQPSSMPSSLWSSSFARSLAVRDISHDTNSRSHWAVAYTSTNSNTTRLAVVGYHGLTTETNVLNYFVCPTAVTFDDDNDEFRAVCSYSGGGLFGLPVAVFTDGITYRYPTAAANVTYGTACGTASIGATPHFRIGGELAQFTLSAAPANSIALLAISTDDIDLDMTVFGFPGCRLLVDPSPAVFLGTLAMLISPTGSSNLQLPIPESVTAIDLAAQWFYFTATGDIVTTRGVRVQVR